MRTVIVLAIVFLSQTVHADESWRCTEEGITREGSVFVSCGTGLHYNIAISKQQALDNSASQFKQMCELDSRCKNKNVSVEPGRSTCDKVRESAYPTLDLYKCVQLIRFSIY